MAPPKVAELLIRVLLLRFTVPALNIAPPDAFKTLALLTAELLDSVLLITVTVAAPLLSMAPPLAATTTPLAIVSPENVTLKSPGTMEKTRPALLPLIVNWFAPGPLINRFLLIDNSPLVSKIVLAAGSKNLISSPDAASLIACLKEPGPLSFELVTTMDRG